MQLLLSLALLSIAIAAAGVASAIATFNHGYRDVVWPSLVATIGTWLAVAPGQWVTRLVSNGPAKQLAIVVWRLMILLPCLVIGGAWDGDARKCFFITLLACYFVGLPLESWLLIRDVRRQREPQP
jgi:hypothetical protein